MAQMIKKQVHIDPEQDKRLKWLSKMLGISEDELIQRAIGSYMSGSHENDRAVSREGSQKRQRVVPIRPMFKWRNRDEMYEIFLAGRGKPLPGLPDEIDECEIERRWQKELRKMRERRFVKLLGDTEKDWDRDRIYDERIDDLPS